MKINPTKTIPEEIITIECLLKNSTIFASTSDFSFKKVDRANIAKYVITIISLPFSAPYFKINGNWIADIKTLATKVISEINMMLSIHYMKNIEMKRIMTRH